MSGCQSASSSAMLQGVSFPQTAPNLFQTRARKRGLSLAFSLYCDALQKCLPFSYSVGMEVEGKAKQRVTMVILEVAE